MKDKPFDKILKESRGNNKKSVSNQTFWMEKLKNHQNDSRNEQRKQEFLMMLSFLNKFANLFVINSRSYRRKEINRLVGKLSN
jgi:hypothetical protein